MYIHIPFCKTACSYCDFHFSVNLQHVEELTDSLINELQIRKDYLPVSESKLDTIYFGGGTPSVLSAQQLEKIIDAIHRNYKLNSNAEITLEANPDDLTKEKLLSLQSLGVNRLSIGIQSFYDHHLQLMNRHHTGELAIAAVNTAADIGFKNITIDLIYGVPGMTHQEWATNLEQAFKLPVQHLSCYWLTVEKKTALEKAIRTGKVMAPDEEAAIKQFYYLIDNVGSGGFTQYEISNFAKPGFHSKHNSNYWSGKSYIGIGPSAHSYDGKSRQWNVASNAAYISALNKMQLNYVREELSPENKFNEYVMTRLRTAAGIQINELTKLFPKEFIDALFDKMTHYLQTGELDTDQISIQLTRKGKLMADHIAAALFV